jgi:hypothetical protein
MKRKAMSGTHPFPTAPAPKVAPRSASPALWAATALLALAAPCAAFAQDTGTTPSAVPTSLPVPVTVPSTSAPVIVLPKPADLPAATTTSPKSKAPRATPTTPAPVPTPKPTPTPAPPRSPSPVASPSPEATATPAARTPSPSAEVAPILASPPAEVPSDATVAASDSPPDNVTDRGESSTGLWITAAIVLAILAGAALYLLRRRSATVAPAAAPEIAPVVPAPPAPVPAPAPAAPIQKTTPPVAPPIAPSPALPAKPVTAAATGLTIALEADRLGATLVNATLSCRLVLRNAGPVPLVDLALSGDMTSAHASRPMDEQLGLAGPELAPLRTIARIEPGESVTVAAEMRLPLSAVLAIRAGQAQLFVPIVRATCWATRATDGGTEHAHGAFLVGQPAVAGDAAARLQPFRLDLGPRVFDRIEQRPMPLPNLA